ncbi:TraB/GumN family protein [Prolixibacteraceae bacterium JC049]|nr:TraB/GumN family protein [Prolixibacteraceae bacterium JC049]
MKKILLSVLVLVFAWNIQAQNALMWKISGNGLDRPSFLYGTIHLACPSVISMKKAKIEVAILQVDQVCLELDMDDLAVIQAVQKGSFNEGMHNFSDELTEEGKEAIDDFLQENFKAGLKQMGVMKPWALAMFISMQDVADCKNPKPFEEFIISLGKKYKKEVIGVETPEEQLSIFNNLDREAEMQLLVRAIEEHEQDKRDFKAMTRYYMKEDLQSLNNMIIRRDDMKKMKKELLDNRNKRWIPRMVKIAKRKPTLFAVGAGHLMGDNGVIQLLKNKGYKVTPVKH